MGEWAGEWVGGVVGVGSVCLTQKRVGADVNKMWHCAVLLNTCTALASVLARSWVFGWKDESAIEAVSLTWLNTVMVSGEKGM